MALPQRAHRAVRRLIVRHGLHGPGDIPVPIRQVVADDGWSLHFREGLAPLLGIAGILEGVQVMWINADVSRPYQRFAMGHEMGHWLCGHISTVQLCVEHDDRFASWVSRRQERQADLAAAHILIPPWTLREFGSLHEIAAACEVPVELVELYRGLMVGSR